MISQRPQNEDPVVKVTREEARKNREAMLAAADDAITRHGAAGPGVAEIARRAGLTHGAVYRHFASKDELAAEAVAHGFDRILRWLETLRAAPNGRETYVGRYLSPEHRDLENLGCPVAALGAEIHRGSPTLQAAFADGLAQLLEALGRVLAQGQEPTAEDRAEAAALLSSLVGALTMARATAAEAPQLSEEILKSARDRLLSDDHAPQGDRR